MSNKIDTVSASTHKGLVSIVCDNHHSFIAVSLQALLSIDDFKSQFLCLNESQA